MSYFVYFIIKFMISMLLSHNTCQLSYEEQKNSSPHYVTVQQGQIEYYRLGQGSPIVLIPGYATDVTSWDRCFLTKLAEQHEVIMLNIRNVGGSIIKSTQYESQDLANDIDQLIQNLKLKKPAILGISMGGMIAQQLAVLHSAHIGQLILINTAIAGKNAIHPSSDVKEKMMHMPSNQLGRYIFAVKLFFPPQAQMRMMYYLAFSRFQPKNNTPVDFASVLPQQRHLLMQWSQDNATGEKLKKLNLPTLILNGEADIVIPPINSVILTNTIPHATLVRWQEGGHAMIYQYPLQIADKVNEFIAENNLRKNSLRQHE